MTDQFNGSDCQPESEIESCNTEPDIAMDRERLRRGLDLCHHVANSNPGLVVSYLSILPDLKEVRQEVEQILLKIAGTSPKVILDNAEYIQVSPWGKEAIEFAQQNTDK